MFVHVYMSTVMRPAKVTRISLCRPYGHPYDEHTKEALFVLLMDGWPVANKTHPVFILLSQETTNRVSVWKFFYPNIRTNRRRPIHCV